MDRIFLYLQAVPWPVLVAGAVVAMSIFIFVPSRWRLPLALVLMPIWMTLGRLPDLGMVQAVAKMSGVMAYVFVFAAAILDPGPKRRLPGVVWIYPIMALVGMVYLPTVTDALFMMVVQFQLFVLTLAAIATVRTVVDEASLMRIIIPLTVGVSGALMIPLSALVFNPSEAFAAGLGRFQPYGANQNQIGVLFVLAMPLSLYLGLRFKSVILKVAFVGVTAAAIGMSIITASRSVLIVILMASVPLGMPILRRPIFMGIVGVIGIAVVGYLLSQPSEVNYSRLETLETGRVQIAIEYMGLIAERPIVGLMASNGMSALSSESIGLHPHNVYIEMLYIGGISYFLPMMIPILYSAICAIRVYLGRKDFAIDPILISMLCAFLIGMYAHGFVNGAILYPTYTWAWWHVTVSVLMIALAGDLRQAASAAEVAETYDEEYPESYGDTGEGWEEYKPAM